MKPLRIFLARVGVRPPFYPVTCPPMGIMYLASYLRSKLDAEVRLFDQRLHNSRNEALVRAAVEFGADVIGLGSMTATARHQREISHLIRKALPDALIVLGGSHVSSFGVDAFEGTPADAAITGEGEEALEQVVRAWSEGRGFGGVPGLIWRDADGSVVQNPGTLPYIEDLDKLPFPAYDLIDVPAYWRGNPNTPIPRLKAISLFSSRGCPFGCAWCHHVFGKRFRPHSAERVVDEIAFFQREYGAKDFEFVDDTFNFDNNRVIEVCELIHRRNLKVTLSFPVGVRTDILTPEGIEALVSAGLLFCSFALESGSPRIQKLMGKRLDIAKFVENVARVAKYRAFTDGFMMLGFPTETEEEVRQTIDIACESKLHTGSFYTVTPFPNTPLYEMVRQNAPEKLSGISYDDMDYSRLNVNLSTLPDHLLYRYQRMATRRFYGSPTRLMRILRDYPKPHLLPLYGPLLLQRLTKGLSIRRDSK